MKIFVNVEPNQLNLSVFKVADRNENAKLLAEQALSAYLFIAMGSAEIADFPQPIQLLNGKCCKELEVLNNVSGLMKTGTSLTDLSAEDSYSAILKLLKFIGIENPLKIIIASVANGRINFQYDLFVEILGRESHDPRLKEKGINLENLEQVQRFMDVLSFVNADDRNLMEWRRLRLYYSMELSYSVLKERLKGRRIMNVPSLA